MKYSKDQSIGMNINQKYNEKIDANNLKRFPLDASFQGVNRLLALAFDNTNDGDNKVERDSYRK